MSAMRLYKQDPWGVRLYNKIAHSKFQWKYLKNNPKYDAFYCAKIGNGTDKGKWLNKFIKRFFTGTHDYNVAGTIHLKLKTTSYKMNNNLNVMIYFFKNLKKLNKDNYLGEVFKAQLIKSTIKEAA